MIGVHEFLSGGARSLEEGGRLLGTAALPAALEGAQALLVLDLEMSGAQAQTHEILDLGGVKADLRPGFPELGSWGSRVKPRHIGNADIGALKVVGYSPRGWRDALELDQALARLADLGGGTIPTGWGIAQDLAFLAEGYRRVGMAWPFAGVAIDVQSIARVVLGGRGEVERFNLGHVADRLGIGRMGEHGALADAYAAYDVLVKLYERLTPPAEPVGAAADR